MAVSQVYSGTLQPNILNQTLKFQNSIGILINAPDITDEIEINFYLQIEPFEQFSDNRLIQLNPEYQANTLTCYTIPAEYQYTGLNLYGVILASFSIACEVWVIAQDLNLETITDQLNNIELELSNLAIEVQNSDCDLTSTNNLINWIISALLSITTGVPLPALPSGGGGGGNSYFLPFVLGSL